MSYDVRLQDPETGETLQLDESHNVQGGTYCMGGTSECWLNITYNYGKFFYATLGEKGIRELYGKKANETLPLLEDAVEALMDDEDPDYWKPTEGNARKALLGLIEFAKAKPEGVWDGD